MKPIYWVSMMAMMLGSAGADAAGWNPQGQTEQMEETQAAIAKFKSSDLGMEVFFQKAYGYAVFPSVGKGGFIFAGAFGRGIVFEQGKPVGRASLTQVTFGFQIGGQAFSEILFFKDKAALDKFKGRNTELAAQASAVVARDGAAAAASYDNSGVAVFIQIKGGGMLEE
jgi:lipid-binding SYLF domain-containing protein